MLSTTRYTPSEVESVLDIAYVAFFAGLGPRRGGLLVVFFAAGFFAAGFLEAGFLATASPLDGSQRGLTLNRSRVTSKGLSEVLPRKRPRSSNVQPLLHPPPTQPESTTPSSKAALKEQSPFLYPALAHEVTPSYAGPICSSTLPAVTYNSPGAGQLTRLWTDGKASQKDGGYKEQVSRKERLGRPALRSVTVAHAAPRCRINVRLTVCLS